MAPRESGGRKVSVCRQSWQWPRRIRVQSWRVIVRLVSGVVHDQRSNRAHKRESPQDDVGTLRPNPDSSLCGSAEKVTRKRSFGEDSDYAIMGARVRRLRLTWSLESERAERHYPGTSRKGSSYAQDMWPRN